MPRGESENSKATRMAQWIIEHGPANTAEAAHRFGITYMAADNTLRQRAKTVGDIMRGRGVWQATSADAQAVLARKRALAAQRAAAAGNAPAFDAEEEAEAQRALVRAQGARKGSGVIAGLRQPPDRKAVWRGHGSSGPIRPGAMDFTAIPSRHGDTRQPYHTGPHQTI